jgi:hypothetical protein
VFGVSAALSVLAGLASLLRGSRQVNGAAPTGPSRDTRASASR